MFKRVCLLIFFLKFINGQTQTLVIGRVMKTDSTAISFANIKLKKTEKGIPILFAICKEDGNYQIKIPDDLYSYILEVSAVGFIPITVQFQSYEAHKTNPNFILNSQTTPLPDVIVKTEPSIEINEDTISFKVDIFKVGNESSVNALIKNIPGFSITESGKIKFNGESVDKILIENDDLTGKNYEKLIKSLNAEGIDKIQVIRNYKDPENILSAFSNPQQVVNLKYKKKYLQKIFGNLNFGISPSNLLFNLKAQQINLNKKAKFIVTESSNSMGDISNETEANDNYQRIISEEKTNNSNSPIEGTSFLASPNDIRGIPIMKKVVNKNTTQMYTLNLRANLISKAIFKTDLQYFSDKYEQRMTNERTFLTTPIVTISKNQLINHLGQSIKANISLNYLLNTRNQINLLYSTQKKKLSKAASSYIGIDNFQEESIGNIVHNSFDFTYNHLLKKNNSIALGFQLYNQKVPNSYVIAPSPYINLFTQLNNVASLSQIEFQSNKVYRSYISYSKKLGMNTFIVKGELTKTKSLLENSIYQTPSFSSPITVNQDSTNNIKLNIDQLTFDVTEIINYKKNSYFTLNLGINAFKLKALYMKRNNFQEATQKIQLLPNFTSSFQINEENKIIFSFNTKNKYSELSQIASGYILNNLTQISIGQDTLIAGIGNSAQLFFSHIDLLKKHIIFFTGIIFQKEPSLYLPNQTPQSQYNIQKYISSKAFSNITSFFFRVDKLLSSNKIKLSPHFTWSHLQSSNILNSDEYVNKFRQTKIGIDLNAKSRLIQFQLETNYSLGTQTRFDKKQNNKLNKFDYNVQLGFRINSNFFVESQFQQEHFTTSNQVPNSWSTFNSFLSWHPKNDKFQLRLDAKNLFNRDQYNAFNISPTEKNLNSYKLFGRIIFISAQVKF